MLTLAACSSSTVADMFATAGHVSPQIVSQNSGMPSTAPPARADVMPAHSPTLRAPVEKSPPGHVEAGRATFPQAAGLWTALPPNHRSSVTDSVTPPRYFRLFLRFVTLQMRFAHVAKY